MIIILSLKLSCFPKKYKKQPGKYVTIQPGLFVTFEIQPYFNKNAKASSMIEGNTRVYKSNKGSVHSSDCRTSFFNGRSLS